jgi:hypothetical protein
MEPITPSPSDPPGRFPVKVHEASAGWTRAVSIFTDD